VNRFVETLKAEHAINAERDRQAKLAKQEQARLDHIAKTIAYVDSYRSTFAKNFAFGIPADYEISDTFHVINFPHEGVAFSVQFTGSATHVRVKAIDGLTIVNDRRSLANLAAAGKLG
jgi:hypothetical protein